MRSQYEGTRIFLVSYGRPGAPGSTSAPGTCLKVGANLMRPSRKPESAAPDRCCACSWSAASNFSHSRLATSSSTRDRSKSILRGCCNDWNDGNGSKSILRGCCNDWNDGNGSRSILRGCCNDWNDGNGSRSVLLGWQRGGVTTVTTVTTVATATTARLQRLCRLQCTCS